MVRVLLVCGFLTAVAQEAQVDRDTMLNMHDKYRCMHDAGKVTWNEEAATQAMNWANELASGTGAGHACYPESKGKDKCTTSDGTYWGENIAYGEGTGMAADIKAINEKVVPEWYSEIENCPPAGACTSFSEDTGHYTQVVWKATTQIGCALKVVGDVDDDDDDDDVDKEYKYYLVCRYAEAGNMQGAYEDNVAPLNGKSEDECSTVTPTTPAAPTTAAPTTVAPTTAPPTAPPAPSTPSPTAPAPTTPAPAPTTPAPTPTSTPTPPTPTPPTPMPPTPTPAPAMPPCGVDAVNTNQNTIGSRCSAVDYNSGQCMFDYAATQGKHCHGLYCNANGMDGDCAWCVYDLDLCNKIYTDGSCNWPRITCADPKNTFI